MEQQGVRKTYQYKLKPTPVQERPLESVPSRRHVLYNTALAQRSKTWWWERCQGKSATYYQQKAALPDLKQSRLEYADLKAHVLQDVLLCAERTYQAFCRRVQAGQVHSYPRFQGSGRHQSFTHPQVGDHGGARLDNGHLALSKIGRFVVWWSRPLVGTHKMVTSSRGADGWYVSFSCTDVPTQPLVSTGSESGVDGKTSAMWGGQRFGPSLKPRQQGPGGKWWPCHPRSPRRTVQPVANACPRAFPFTPTSVRPVASSLTATTTRRAVCFGPGGPVRRAVATAAAVN